jgi:rubredoxin
MASPCPRCGATKTISVRHGLIYNTVWMMGYHLRLCSFCGRRRLFKRAQRSGPHPDDMTYKQLQEHYDRKVAVSSRRAPAEPETPAPEMAPEYAQASVGRRTSEAARSVSAAEADHELDDSHYCPKCGSTFYRRSRRRFFERLLKRPKMARCLRCNHRFPYPGHPHRRA